MLLKMSYFTTFLEILLLKFGKVMQSSKQLMGNTVKKKKLIPFSSVFKFNMINLDMKFTVFGVLQEFFLILFSMTISNILMNIYAEQRPVLEGYQWSLGFCTLGTFTSVSYKELAHRYVLMEQKIGFL